MTSAPVIVIVVAYHGDRWIPECLNSLRDSLATPIRLVLLDNAGNTCIERLAVEGFNCVVLRCNEPMGFAEANNFALRREVLEAEAVCFLNQDTRSERGWLDHCLGALQDDPKLGAVSPMLRTYDWAAWDPAFLDCIRGTELAQRLDEEQAALPDVVEVARITAAAMVIRTATLLEVGPFDPIYGSYYEDYDLCLRVKAAGYRLGVCPRAMVAHYSGSATNSAAAERRRARAMLRNRSIYELRQAGGRRWAAVAKLLLWKWPYRLARGVLRTPSSQSLDVQFGALKDLLSVLWRVSSARRDVKAWRKYLVTLGWPGSAGKR